jgi:2,4-dienoyl-CoA reductase-like NADH-dependent reductase (Old Yellow Enzyme family)
MENVERSPGVTTHSTAALFTPFVLARLVLPNRIVMAPMTRSQSPGGVPDDHVVGYYRRRAEHGVGLIVTEGTAIAHPAAVGNPRIPRFHGDDALAGWAKVVAAVHVAGGRIMPQLWHVGMARKAGSEPNPEAPSVGPSGLDLTGALVGEPLTETAIAAIIEAYAQGAADAQRIGFDGIELHGAHGYLIDQFFWERTNKRTDRYGGDAVARTRFAVEVIRACRARTSPDFPIVLRFSQWKIQQYDVRPITSPDELARFLAPLAAAGVTAFHCSTRRFWLPEFEGSDLNLAGWTKKLTGLPTITVGSLGLDHAFMSGPQEATYPPLAGLDAIARMIERGDVDLVAVGRALLADPAWAEKVRAGRLDTVIPYTSDALKTLS